MRLILVPFFYKDKLKPLRDFLAENNYEFLVDEFMQIKFYNNEFILINFIIYIYEFYKL